MHPSERIKYIRQISKELSKEQWGLIDLTLRQFGLPWSDTWGGNDRESYVVEMLSNTEDVPLLELAKHLGLASQLAAPNEPSFWKNNEARVFLSHLSVNKAETAQLRYYLNRYGISAFVAHEDIEPTKEWQTEIETALATMDALIALLAPGFKESNWCDQEVGVAIGRQVPIISIRQGLDPYGFIGKYQALQGAGKSSIQIAKEIFDIFILMPAIGQKITNTLVNDLVNSDSFDQSKRLISLINQSKYITSKHATMMKEAINNNSQVSESWGVPEQISEVVKRFEANGI